MATWQDLYECIVCNNSIDCFIREHHLKPSRLKKLMRSKNLLEALEVRRAAGVLMAYANAGSSAASAVWRLDQILVGHTAGAETTRKAAMAVIKLAQDAKGYIATLVSAAQGADAEPLPIANCPLPIEQPEAEPRAAGSSTPLPPRERSAGGRAAASGRVRVWPANSPSTYPPPSSGRSEETAEDLRSQDDALSMPRGNGRVGDEASPTLQLARPRGEEATADTAANAAAVAPEAPVPTPAKTFPSVPPRSATFRPVPKLNRGRAEIMTRKLLHRLGLQDLTTTKVICLVTGNEKEGSGVTG
jgi:hypothetical protein